MRPSKFRPNPPKFRPNRLIGRRVIAFLTFELELCYSGPTMKSGMRFDYPIKNLC